MVDLDAKTATVESRPAGQRQGADSGGTTDAGYEVKGIPMKADKEQVRRLYAKTARGQLDGILNMVEQDRYCIDISKSDHGDHVHSDQGQCGHFAGSYVLLHREAAESGDADEKLEEIPAAAKLLK